MMILHLDCQAFIASKEKCTRLFYFFIRDFLTFFCDFLNLYELSPIDLPHGLSLQNVVF